MHHFDKFLGNIVPVQPLLDGLFRNRLSNVVGDDVCAAVKEFF